MIYGVTTAVSAALFLIFARSKPPTPAGPPEDEVRALVLDGFKMMLKQRDVYFLSFALFIGSGIVNAVFTLIDGLGREKGLTTEQGVTLTIVLLAGGNHRQHRPARIFGRGPTKENDHTSRHFRRRPFDPVPGDGNRV